jgi:hypothetical protein
VTVYSHVTDANGGSTTNSFLLTITPVNDAPTISAIGPQTINEDTVLGPVSFTVGDVETPASSLSVSAASSNPSLVPSGNVILGGSGAVRTLTLTPATNLFASAMISITVSDGTSNTIGTFSLTVNSINDLPTMSALPNRTIDEDNGTGAMSFTLGDVETPVASLTLTGASTNTTLVPVSAIVFGGSGGNRTVAVTPAPDQSGTTLITVTVEGARRSAPSVKSLPNKRFVYPVGASSGPLGALQLASVTSPRRGVARSWLQEEARKSPSAFSSSMMIRPFAAR